SATLMNKGLELIEATHLFGVDESRIEVVVHPQSIVHSLVEFRDGSWLAQLSVNDMVFPLQYALAYPERWDNDFPRLDLQSLRALEFLPVDEARFPAIGLARKALRLGDAGPAVYNAANEVAVHAFLQGAVPFPAIFDAVADALEAMAQEPASRWESIEAALEVDEATRAATRRRLAVRHPTAADRI
ncbi:MAG: 1-deoxy-D-xylulose-5-phosphate reductoisomerase, partial [Thermoanaerobaculia bacterium]|nr:1-deoxy-D-xylulose-5-phosphate reductoisomerase [Thermoanaerobaculia bacterium]